MMKDNAGSSSQTRTNTGNRDAARKQTNKQTTNNAGFRFYQCITLIDRNCQMFAD